MRPAEHRRRDDPDLCAVIRAARAGLGRPAPTSRPCHGTGWLSDLLFPTILCLVLAGLLVQPALTAYFGASHPAYIGDTAALVRGGFAPAPAGRFLMTIVAPRAADGRSGEEANHAMNSSRRNALAAALVCAGTNASGRESIEISSGKLTGPSAGLIFALTVVDLLLPEDITQARRIAATGTISRRGKVGAVGELPLKAQAAERAGADIFIVPDAQAPDAQRHVTRLAVVGVGNLDEALRALGAPGCPA